MKILLAALTAVSFGMWQHNFDAGFFMWFLLLYVSFTTWKYSK